MKLNKEIKERIDNYFDNISAEELYEISLKYGFVEDFGFEISNTMMDNLNVDIYTSSTDQSYDSTDDSNLPLAA
ncbi:hypothetical protein [Lutibacter sp. B1]|uniref:hypothetical protein n=1 Tax=Lutibacter sp. B1 TaxID=2725996 RepID=UPI0014576942|nr:hypothetical protein [Lutibacter sp. B1]NLP59472.1 hypothetical protein [Lutibacter sp. B1]